jgi:hypothetical protein
MAASRWLKTALVHIHKDEMAVGALHNAELAQG